MKLTKKFLANSTLSIFAALLFYGLLSFLELEDGQVYHVTGFGTYWILIGTVALAIVTGWCLYMLSRQKLLWGIPRTFCFLWIGAWFYTNTPITLDSSLLAPSLEGLVWVFAAATYGLLLGWGVKTVLRVRTKPDRKRIRGL